MERWLRIEKAAALLDVSPKTLRRWIEIGSFPKPVEVNGIKRWPQRVVEGWKAILEFGFSLARETTRQEQKSPANRDSKRQEGTN